VKFARILTTIKTRYEYYNLLFFLGQKNPSIVQNKLLFIVVLLWKIE